MAAAEILVPVSAGELLDKISILEIKVARIRDAAKAGLARQELALLNDVAAARIPERDDIRRLRAGLAEVNEALWEIEDGIRAQEKAGSFGSEFVSLARSVYITNDRRAELKRAINLALGSAIVEVKEYD